MRRSTIISLCATLSVLLLMACSGGGGSSSNPPSQQANTGTVNTIISDDATQDWATIGVKVLSVTLTPQGGGTPVTIYAPSSGAPFINLMQLDQLGEIIGNATIPTGTYSQATITVSANPADVLLIASPDPEPGFPVLSPPTIPSTQICVVTSAGSCGVAGSTVSVPLTLATPMSMGGNSSNALDLEFNLSHPAFIVQHQPATGGTIWAVNFNPILRHHPIADITKLVLRHSYGTNITVSSDDTSFTMDKIFLPVPAPSPITNSNVTASTQTLTILADSSNVNGLGGTIFWNLDASAGSQRTVISSFQSVASILSQPGEFVRVQARYQAGGTLVAVRVWASTSFSKVFVSPEGHVLDVNPSTAATNPDTFTVTTESGTASAPISVTANTNFYFNNALVGTGTSVLNNPGTSQPLFVRGFKVHVNPADPTASQLVADTVNIEIARYDGAISGSSPTGFTYTRTFDAAHASDDYTVNLDYISSSTPNGYDDNNNPLSGFKWWYFAQPTSTLSCFGGGCVNGANNPITGTGGFVATTTSANVSYGNSCVPAGFTATNFVATQPIVGETYATWNDAADLNDAWSAQWAILLPTPALLSTVGTINPSGSFTMTPVGTNCSTPITVDLDTTQGQATLAYQVNRSSSGVVTVTATTLNALLGGTAGFQSGTPVKVYGVPVAGASGNGTIQAYVLLYFTGTAPTQ